MRKQAIGYLCRVGVQKVIGLLLYLAGAGFSLSLRGGLYFAVLILATLFIGGVLLRADEALLAARGKANTDSPLWDKILLPVFWLLNYFIVYWPAGRADTAASPDGAYWLGMALMLFAAWFSTKASLANRFLESTSRIQADRAQTVCTTGPYRIVRHPAYSGLLLNCIATCMLFPCGGVYLCMAVTAAVIVLRTALEDRMLRSGLHGYAEYAGQTRYRLIPFLW